MKVNENKKKYSKFFAQKIFVYLNNYIDLPYQKLQVSCF